VLRGKCCKTAVTLLPENLVRYRSETTVLVLQGEISSTARILFKSECVCIKQFIVSIGDSMSAAQLIRHAGACLGTFFLSLGTLVSVPSHFS